MLNLKKVMSFMLALVFCFAFAAMPVSASAAETAKTVSIYEYENGKVTKIGTIARHTVDDYDYARVTDLAAAFDVELVNSAQGIHTLRARSNDGKVFAGKPLEAIDWKQSEWLFINGATGQALQNVYDNSGTSIIEMGNFTNFVGLNYLAYIGGDNSHLLIGNKVQSGVDYEKALNDYLPKKGSRENPFTLSELQKEQLEGGYKYFTGDYKKEVFVLVDGNEIGIIEYGNSEVSKTAKGFGTQTLNRGETITLSVFEATLWLQNEPIAVTDFSFGNKDCKKADNQGYGWVYKPTEPIEFVVSSDVKVIQSYDPRDGEVHEYKSGDTAYVGRDGATFWFNKAKPASDVSTTYVK